MNSTIAKILVLSDGKPGHYNQSLGIIDRFDNIYTQTIQIIFKKKWRDNLIRIFGYIFGGLRISNWLITSVLRWALDKSSANELLSARDFDLILSTGSSVASSNLLMSKMIKAKSVVCTRPSPLGIRHFDLAILPEHSKPRKIPKNVVMTLGVPNRITPRSVRIAGSDLSQKNSISNKRIIGVLLGGDDPYCRIPANMASSLSDILLDICNQINTQIAITTSRRTCDSAEEILKSTLKNDPACCFFVSAKESNQGNVVQGILGISNIAIVTEDSFSMVCESASSGKKTIILDVERKNKPYARREKVYKLLVEQSYARRSNLQNLKTDLINYMNDRSKPKILNDAEVAAKALKQILEKR